MIQIHVDIKKQQMRSIGVKMSNIISTKQEMKNWKKHRSSHIRMSESHIPINTSERLDLNENKDRVYELLNAIDKSGYKTFKLKNLKNYLPRNRRKYINILSYFRSKGIIIEYRRTKNNSIILWKKNFGDIREAEMMLK